VSTTHPLTIALIAAGSSLLAILLTPLLQHHFWRYQKRDEIRLATIKDFNGLTSQFIADFLWGTKPGAGWFKAFNVVCGEIEVLFLVRSSRSSYSPFWWILSAIDMAAA